MKDCVFLLYLIKSTFKGHQPLFLAVIRFFNALNRLQEQKQEEM